MVDYNIAIPQQQLFQAPDFTQNAMRMQQMQTQDASAQSANQLRAMQTRGLEQGQQLTAIQIQAAKQNMAAAAATAREQAAARAEALRDKNALANAMQRDVVGLYGPQERDLNRIANTLDAEGRFNPAATVRAAVNAATESGKKKVDLSKAEADLSKVNIETLDKHFNVFRSLAPQVTTPENAGVYVGAMYDHPEIGKLMAQTGLTREQAVAQGMQQFAENPKQWLAAHVGLTAQQSVDVLKTMQKETDLGGQISTQKQNYFGDDIGAPTVLDKTLTPAEAARGSKVQIPNLRAGEKWDPVNERVDAIPGSDLYVSQAIKHEKDMKAVKGIERKSTEAIKNIDRILSPENEKGLAQQFGGFGAYVTQYGAGETADVANLIAQFKSSLKSAGLEEFRTGGSIGAMTVAEWPIVEAEIASLNPKMTLEAAKATMRRVQTRLQGMADDARGTYNDTWQRTQFHKPRVSGQDKPPIGTFDRK
jgi:hypothetical protein